MLKKKISELAIGMKLARPVLGPKALSLIQEGAVLDEENISLLKRWGIEFVYVVGPVSAISLDEEIEREEALRRAEYQKTFDKAVDCSQNMLHSVLMDEPLKVEEVADTVTEMIGKVIESRDILVQLTRMNIMENYIFSHAVNVCTYALVVGTYLDLTSRQLLELGVAALLHDVGMIRLNEDIWNHSKPLKENNWQMIKTHPVIGAEVLQSLTSYPKSILDAVRDHHERRDGSGYPNGKSGSSISYMGQVIGIVNIYDSLTASRKYRSAITPHEAIKIILSAGDSQFDGHIVRSFISHFAIYPVGSLVQLSSGEIARVTGITPEQPFRPRLKVLFDNTLKRQEKARRLDLREQDNELIYVARSISHEEMTAMTGIS